MDPQTSSAPPAPESGESGDPATEGLGLRELKKRQTRVAMHRAALELVAEHGFTQVTVEMIARRAGVSTRTFFNHWTTKDAAVLGVITGDSLEVSDRLRAELAEHSPREALRAVLRDALTAIPADPELRELKKQVMAKEPLLHSISSGRLLEVQTEMTEALTAALEGDEARTRAVVAVQVGFALTRSAFALSMAKGIDPLAAFDEVTDLYDAGIIEA
ncbi:TetR/AcrR family transcriptional regulator [Brachybacterium fresconis]|uniref:AcrR family transcriptional regulator n=1 Tax=Brachybacterium fresconis TaxID=173363 RepID=A0ABS4YPG3_9MICO|nr:TetR/AcrR family transcriptional regulator [Brachybacterium fresconis]MBP2410639.1 AcrR family transcriptional regulator [Brachybacterium fresconis]